MPTSVSVSSFGCTLWIVTDLPDSGAHGHHQILSFTPRRKLAACLLVLPCSVLSSVIKKLLLSVRHENVNDDKNKPPNRNPLTNMHTLIQSHKFCELVVNDVFAMVTNP